jgi:hypothetical protein
LGSAQAGIVSISSGSAVVGDHTSNLIANGSFETGAVGTQRWAGAAGQALGGTPNGDGASVAIPSWNAAFDTGAYGWWGPLSFAGAPCANGTSCLYFGNSFATLNSAATFGANGVVTFAGTAGLTGNFAGNSDPVVLSQTVSGLVVGSTYTLDFWVSGESNTNGFNNSGIFGLDVGSDSVFLTAVAANANGSGISGASKRYLVTFTADSTSETIAFKNWGHACNTCTELVLDDVILNAVASNVPEPGALSLVGLSLLGAFAAVRRRRTR